MADDTKCIARASKGFEKKFSSWVENLPHNSTIALNQSVISDSPWNSFLSTLAMKPNDTSASFDVNRFGTFTANFKGVPPGLPPEQLSVLVITILTGFIGSWFFPTVIGWTKTKKEASKFERYHDEAKKLYNKLDMNAINQLSDLRDDITDEYSRGKINKEQYDNLGDVISIGYGEIFTKEIDSLSNLSENDKVNQLSTIISDIEDLRTKGKINNGYYANLKKETSILYGEIFNKRNRFTE